MKKWNVLKLLSLTLVSVCVCFAAMLVYAEESSSNKNFKYYYEQLRTEEAKGIYTTLESMLANGDLEKGNVTVDLVELGILENKAYEKDALMADFISARDAFMFDHNIFYVDFDKFSLSQTQSGKGYAVNMGIGREKTYFADGFDADTAVDAIITFENKVDTIAQKAAQKTELDEQIRVAYDEVIRTVAYALEKDAKPENVLFVRNPYGALVKGESVCEGYARALKAVLDKLEIDNVIVQGMYVDDEDFNSNGSTLEPHMWNYVKMDDNRWYLLDATMGDGAGVNAAYYFLKDGTQDIVKYYQPDGVISLSSLSMEFSYPSLSGSEYQRMSLAFTYETQADETRHISYKGKGFAKAKEAGQHIVCSFDGAQWFYLENYMTWVSAVASPVQLEDYENYFVEPSALGMAYYGVTEVSPSTDMPSSSSDWSDFYTCLGEVCDISKAGEVIELKKSAPVPVTKTPVTSRLDGGKVYDVTVTYSEPLTLANKANPAGIKGTDAVSEGSQYTNFKWDEKNPSVISFTFTTSSTYNYSTAYYFEFTNLVGAESLLAPKPVGFYVVNTPAFVCPKATGFVNTIYANTPALIADSNLAESDWLDKDGNSIGSNLPSRLALVAAPVEGEDAKKYEDKIGGNIKAAQTYDLSLTLCSSQVSFISGKKLKVFVPFPAGLNADSGVTFKAYHFDKNGNPEEITCVTTAHGIIMMCDAFSTYTVAAVEQESEPEKNVLVSVFGDGGVYLPSEENTVELLKLQNAAAQSVVIKANAGHKIESILLNGNAVAVSNNKEMAISLDYAELLAAGNTLEVSFAVLTAADEGGIPIYTAPVINEGLVYNAAEQVLLTAGSVEFGTMFYSLDKENWYETVPTAKNAGDYTVWYKIEGDATHDSVEPQELHVKIEAKSIYVTLSGKAEKVYDDNNSVTDMTQLIYELTGVEEADKNTVQVNTADAYATFESAAAGENIAVTVYDLKLNTDNYVLTSNQATANIGKITQATLDYTAPHPVNDLVYNGTEQALISAGSISAGSQGSFQYRLEGGLWSENLPTGKDAGNYKVYYKIVGGSNYQDEQEKSMIVHIAPKMVEVSAAGTVEKTYDGSHDATNFISNITYSVSGLCGTETIADVLDTSRVTAVFADENAGTGKAIIIQGLQIKNKNYRLDENADVTATGSILPKELTIILTGVVEKTYDKTTTVTDTAGLQFELSGMIAGDTSDVAVDYNSGAFVYETAHAGHDILVTAKNLGITGTKANNYILTSASASAYIGVIHPKMLSVMVNGSASKVYDGTTDADVSQLVFGLKTVLSGDVVRVDASYATAVFASSDVGDNKDVIVTGLIIDNHNYMLSPDDVRAKVGSISKAELTVTVNHETIEKGSDMPNFDVHYEGFVGVEDESVLSGTLVYDCDYTKESEAGKYDVAVSGLTSANYKILFVNGTLTVYEHLVPEYVISEIKNPIDDVNSELKITFGTSIDELKAMLPSEIAVTYEMKDIVASRKRLAGAANVAMIRVTWNMGDYNPEAAKTYELTGTFNREDLEKYNIVNAEQFVPKIKVTVLAKVTPTPTPTEKPAEPTPTPTEKPAEPTPTPTEKPAEPTPTPTEKPAKPTPTPTEKPAEPTPTPTGKPVLPDTGDSSNWMVWVCILIASAAVVCMVCGKRMRTKF